MRRHKEIPAVISERGIPFSRISLDVAVSADNKLTLTYDAKTSNETLPVSYTHLDVYKRQL